MRIVGDLWVLSISIYIDSVVVGGLVDIYLCLFWI